MYNQIGRHTIRSWAGARQSGFRPIVSVCAVLVVAVGCHQDKPTLTNPIPLPDTFSHSGTAPVQAVWWESFDDTGLHRAIAIALADNLDLRGVWDRLSQAEAVARREGAGRYPGVDFVAGAGRTGQRLSGNTSHTGSFLLGLAVEYEVDLWGRVRSAHEAERYNVAATEWDVQAAALSLSASVATAWYRLAEASAQVNVLSEQAQTNRELLELVTERFRQGQVQAADVLRQRQLLESTQGLQSLAQQDRAVLQHQLAVLLGRPPTDELNMPQPALVHAAPLPRTGIPAELLQRRPDVQSARLGVLATDRRMATAIRNQYPRISLVGDLQTGGSHTRDLFNNWLASLAANLVQPLFDAGRLASEVDRHRALVSEAIHQYGLAILTALREVEDALSSESYQTIYLSSLDEQLKTADGVIERTRASYLNGQLDYLRVLDAVTSRQSLEREHLRARLVLLEFRIQLHRALAGPISINRPDLATLEEPIDAP